MSLSMLLGTPPRRTNGRIAFGASIGNHPTMAAATWDAGVANMGRVPTFYTWFHNLSADGWYSSYATWCRDRGMIAMPTLEFQNGGTAVLDAINAGTWDTIIDNYGTGLHGWLTGKDTIVILRPLHEGNGSWLDWGIAHPDGTNSAADYIAAWQRIHSRIMARGSQDAKIKFFWCPNAGTAGVDDIYPGDAYVDYVGLDGYNWGSHANGPWATFEEVIGHSTEGYDEVYTVASASKPFIVGEFGCCDGTFAGANDLGRWFRDAQEALMGGRFPRIVGACYFNLTADTVAWGIQSDAAKQSAGRDLFRRLNGRLG